MGFKLVLVITLIIAPITPALPQGQVWQIVPGESVGPLRLGMSTSRVQSIVGAPDTTCTRIATLEPQNPSPGTPPIPAAATSEFYLSNLGVVLAFTSKDELFEVAVYKDRVFELQSYTAPSGWRNDLSCRGTRPVRLRAASITFSASGVSLGSPAETVFQVFGTPDVSIGAASGLQLIYLHKGIWFTVDSAEVTEIEVHPPAGR